MQYLKEKFAASVHLAQARRPDSGLGAPDAMTTFFDHQPGSGPAALVVVYVPVADPTTDANGTVFNEDPVVRDLARRLGTFAEITLDSEDYARRLRNARLHYDIRHESPAVWVMGQANTPHGLMEQSWHLVNVSRMSLVGAVEVDLRDPAFGYA